jgi:soluble lytic murein transglycosylase
MKVFCRVPTLLMACAGLLFVAGAADAAGTSKKRIPMPRAKPAAVAAPNILPPARTASPLAPTPVASPARGPTVASAFRDLPRELIPALIKKVMPRQALALQNPAPLAVAPTSATSPADLAAVKRAFDSIRKGKDSDALAAQATIGDPVAQKLVEWMLLRSSDASFERYAAFVRANPSWPSVGMLRRRAEGALWDNRRDPSLVRAFFATTPPQSGKGRLALARALLAEGDRDGALGYLRAAWHGDALTADGEDRVIAAFGDLITRADHKARMDRFLYSDDRDIAMRAAKRLGSVELALAKARIAVNARSKKADVLLAAVPASAHGDPGYVFSRIQWLRRKAKIAEAARAMLAAPNKPALLHDLDEWWIERRVMARELLDIHDYKSAYRVVVDAAEPEKENYRVDRAFMAGWIALRFLNDAAAARGHFAAIPEKTAHPIGLARAGYWHGRAYEALGEKAKARAQYESAARFSVAYYGQLARARLGLRDIDLQHPPALEGAHRAMLRNLEIVRAVELLYAIDERDLVVTMAADLEDKIADAGALSMLAQVARQHHDARAMLYIGKAALAQGVRLDTYAFPDIGMPKYPPIGPAIDASLLYAVARQESAFKQASRSSANAMGLMQVTPAAARYIAKKFDRSYDRNKLASDPVYNVQMGAAELGDLLRDYDGCHILSFVGYNAGRGRVRDWIKRYGDPRDPKVDPIDWVERIPFAETRNYVQRVMENAQVYRARFRDDARLTIEADLRGSARSE